MSHQFNPPASDFAPVSEFPGYSCKNETPNEVRTSPTLHVSTRVLNLEDELAALHDDVDILMELYPDVSFSIEKFKKGGWPVHIGPFREVDLTESHQNAEQFKLDLEQLCREGHTSLDGGADIDKVNKVEFSKLDDSMPSSMKSPSTPSKRTASRSLPPHLRNVKSVATEKQNEIRNSHIDTPSSPTPVANGKCNLELKEQKIPSPSRSPPFSPGTTVVEANPQLKDLSLDLWKPHYLTTLPAIFPDIQSKIPADNVITFHADFIRNTFDGLAWSPGLRYIQGKRPCILKNRTYYLLDPLNEPFLPKHPGDHGAKLTAIFNIAPEEKFGELENGASSYENVPMFISVRDNKGRVRYAYYGNYSQTRWSDKLDYDTMRSKVPQHVKEFWAEELAAKTREDWVTKELKNHFFKKPEYEGRLYAALDDETTINSSEEVKLNDRMAKDVKRYVEELRQWEREANMRVSMIKKDFILQAFERADADDPPALRLWWEYLQCVDWNKDFYDLLVTLQSRDASRYLQ